MLLRWLPVASWVGGGLAIGAAAALRMTRAEAFPWGRLALATLGGVLLQGLTAHAFNDWEDWRSGTDCRSPGRLSGGSRVVPRGLASREDLLPAGVGALTLAAAVAALLARETGALPLLLWALGAWSAWSYSLPPLRLAYRPLAGEWLAAFPAIAAVAPGVEHLLAGRATAAGWLSGASHALFCLVWLMQHHLADIAADLSAAPPKRTTPAWLAHRLGLRWARLPGIVYSCAALLLAAGAARRVSRGFLGSAALAFAGAVVAAGTRPDEEPDIARREVILIALTAANAAVLCLTILAGG